MAKQKLKSKATKKKTEETEIYAQKRKRESRWRNLFGAQPGPNKHFDCRQLFCFSTVRRYFLSNFPYIHSFARAHYRKMFVHCSITLQKYRQYRVQMRAYIEHNKGGNVLYMCGTW